MGRNRKNKNQTARFPLKEETRHSVWAVILFLVAVFFVLASAGYAGQAGNLAYEFLEKIVGWGFYLFPLAFSIIGWNLLQSRQPEAIKPVILGGALLFVGGLGLLHALGGPEAGGIIGRALAAPLVDLFDIYMTALILAALVVLGSLLLFDTKLTLEHSLFGWGKQRLPPTVADEGGLPAATEQVEESENDNEEEVYKETPAPTAKRQPDEFTPAPSIPRTKMTAEFKPPPLSLLESDSEKPVAGDIKANANIIKRTLYNFGIVVEMDEISIGPSITRYALKPAEGIKLSKIIGLQNDLALALAAHPIRIEAPIPGLALVGIEIPNKSRSTVRLASLIGSPAIKNSPLPLVFSIGRDTSGTPHFANLARSPHLLVAGSTGSGKSVVIHALIVSLLYRNSPETLRFLLIDPKRVELTLYNRVPHLLTPVITDPKKAIAALKWAIGEMERRYQILEGEQVRDIQSYHQLKPVKEEEPRENLPYIVIVIDELADIMTSYPRELEAVIVRLAQMSRAVGIHLVLSTQRPSVEILTGLIKANIPSRIALQVASQIDSRTILDMAGAEKLLGAGDMLYLSGERSKPLRLQSAFIGEEETKKVVNWLAKNYEDISPSELALDEETLRRQGAMASGGDNDDNDELYEEARELVIHSGKASASYLQRRLKVGYARAARLLDLLEEHSIIGPGEGAKPREVYERAGGAEEDLSS